MKNFAEDFFVWCDGCETCWLTYVVQLWALVLEGEF